MPTFTDYKIAAGWDQAGSLALIGGITATSDVKFAEPAAQQNYSPGKPLLRLDLNTTMVGVSSQVWIMGVTWLQYTYLRTTYCAGGYGGKVTIRTRWQGGNYANYNSVLSIPTENLNFTLNGYSNVPFTFYDLRAI